MSADSTARDHAVDFRWWHGNPDLAEAESELRDLAALRDAVAELTIERASESMLARELTARRIGATSGIESREALCLLGEIDDLRN